MSIKVFRCVNCGGDLGANNGHLACQRCASKFEIRQGIPILTAKERYWCNVSKKDMERLNDVAEKGYWRDALGAHLGANVADHARAESRIDFRYILPSLKNK